MYIKNLAKLFFSGGVIQLLPLLAIPLYTRIYDAKSIAIYGVVLAMTVTVMPLLTFRLEHALLNEKIKKRALKLIIEIVTISIIMSCIISSLISIWYQDVSSIILSIVFISAAFFNITQNYNINNENYSRVSAPRVLKAMVEIFSSIVIGLNFITDYGLLYGVIIGYFSANVFSFIYLMLDYFSNGIAKKVVASKYFSTYVTFDVPASFINMLSANSLVYVFTFSNVSHEFMASLTMALRLLNAPSTLIVNSIGAVFRGSAIEEFKCNGKYDNAFLKSIKLTIPIAVPATLLIIILPQNYYDFIFGKSLSHLSEVLKIVSLVLPVKLLAMSVSYSFYISSMLNLNFKFQFLSLIICFVGYFVVYLFNGFEMYGLYFYSIFMFVYYLFFLRFCYLMSVNKL